MNHKDEILCGRLNICNTSAEQSNESIGLSLRSIVLPFSVIIGVMVLGHRFMLS